MNAPRLVARWFGGGWWPRLAGVLKASAAAHCPTWDLDVALIGPAARVAGSHLEVVNAHKLEAWAAAVAEATDGDRLLLIDADTAIVRSLEDVWLDQTFDLAYTVKPAGSRYPLNAGVIFLRVSPATRDFMAAWLRENDAMFEDKRRLAVWSPYYGGFNQAAFGALKRGGALDGLVVRRLSCLEWNCEDEHWHLFDPAVTRILHVKGALHRALTGRGGTAVTLPDGTRFNLRPLMDRWHALELEGLMDRERRLGAAIPREAPEQLPGPPDPPPMPEDPLVNPEAPDVPPLEDTMVRPGDLSHRPQKPSARRRPPKAERPTLEGGR